MCKGNASGKAGQRVLKPASAECRWLRSPAWPCVSYPQGRPGLLELESDQGPTPYVVSPLPGAKAFRLKKVGTETAYDVVCGPVVWECDCGDYVFNRAQAATAELRECKHCRSLRAALGALYAG